jgi:hypothetical protein
MNRFECNVNALKTPAIVLLLTLLAGAALVWSSEAYLSAHELRRQQARNALNAVREEFRQAMAAETIISTARQRYRELEQRGFIGDEPRLVWIEALRNSGRKHHLYSLQYDLKQRQPLQLAGLDSSEHYRVYGSFMRLDAELAHEVDLLRYFAELERDRPALWTLRGCSLTSMTQRAAISLDKPNIKASCDLAWFTVKPYAADDEQEGSL